MLSWVPGILRQNCASELVGFFPETLALLLDLLVTVGRLFSLRAAVCDRCHTGNVSGRIMHERKLKKQIISRISAILCIYASRSHLTRSLRTKKLKTPEQA